ncbi:MAG: ferrochelatase, partial [Pseudorhodoplanes sp.]
MTAASPARPNQSGARIGVLLLNLGTPEAADAASIRRYLKQFLSDRRVIEKDSFLWRLVLIGFILPFRPRAKSRDYAKIWNRERNESPFKTITRSQAEKRTAALSKVMVGVEWA